MKAAHLLGLTFLAAVIGAGIDRLFVTLSSRSTHPSAGFEMQDVKWDRTEGHGYVAHSGSARVVGKGEAATGRYLVLVEFIRSQRVNPADRPDTQWATVMTSQGSGLVSGEDHAYDCSWSRTIKPPACAPELRELVARWQVAGWVKLAEPTPDSSRWH